MELTQSYLKTALHYDPDTGVFTWQPRDHSHFKTPGSSKVWHARFSGKNAGHSDDGYIRIKLLGKNHLAHRLAFLCMTGEFPPHEVDHISGVRNDNRWTNLRAVTGSENNKNTKIRADNTSGILGVYWHKASSKWQASIGVDGRFIHLGLFNNIEEAADARKLANKKHGFHQNHGRAAK